MGKAKNATSRIKFDKGWKQGYYRVVKKILGLVISVVFLFTLSVTVFAQSPNAEIPERNGDYPDPDHPGLRVRVFVHEPHQGKPNPPSQPAECSDASSSAVVGPTSWKLPSGDFKYKINPSSVPSSVGGANLSSIVSNGFNAWTASINSTARPNLVADGTTTKTRNSLDGQNIITWGRTNGSALGVTYVWYYTATKLVAEVDTVMNQKFPWNYASCNPSYYNAEDILVHELGHWFGLNDEYNTSYVENTMYGYGSKGEIKKITPTDGDKAGINLIYPL